MKTQISDTDLDFLNQEAGGVNKLNDGQIIEGDREGDLNRE